MTLLGIVKMAHAELVGVQLLFGWCLATEKYFAVVSRSMADAESRDGDGGG